MKWDHNIYLIGLWWSRNELTQHISVCLSPSLHSTSHIYPRPCLAVTSALSVWPLSWHHLVVWPVSVSCHGCGLHEPVCFWGQCWRVLGPSCPRVKALSRKSSLKPHHLRIKWDGHAISGGGGVWGGLWGRGMGEMICPHSPKIPVAGGSSPGWGLCLHPAASILLEENPPTMWLLVCLTRVWDLPEKMMKMTALVSPTTGQGGEVGKETFEEVSVGPDPAPNTPPHPRLACRDLDGNTFTSQIDELAAGHPAAGCFNPDWKPRVTCPWEINRRNQC